MKTFGRILRFDNTEILMVESGHHIEQKMTWFCAVAQNIVIINENWLELEIDYDYNVYFNIFKSANNETNLSQLCWKLPSMTSKSSSSS